MTDTDTATSVARPKRSLPLPPYRYASADDGCGSQWKERLKSVSPHVEVNDLLFLPSSSTSTVLYLVAGTSRGTVVVWSIDGLSAPAESSGPSPLATRQVSASPIQSLQPVPSPTGSGVGSPSRLLVASTNGLFLLDFHSDILGSTDAGTRRESPSLIRLDASLAFLPTFCQARVHEGYAYALSLDSSVHKVDLETHKVVHKYATSDGGVDASSSSTIRGGSGSGNRQKAMHVLNRGRLALSPPSAVLQNTHTSSDNVWDLQPLSPRLPAPQLEIAPSPSSAGPLLLVSNGVHSAFADTQYLSVFNINSTDRGSEVIDVIDAVKNHGRTKPAFQFGRPSVSARDRPSLPAINAIASTSSWWTIGGTTDCLVSPPAFSSSPSHSSLSSSSSASSTKGFVSIWHGPTRSLVSCKKTRTIPQCIRDSNEDSNETICLSNEGVVAMYDTSLQERKLWCSPPSGLSIATTDNGTFAVAGVGPTVDIFRDGCKSLSLSLY